ncbi:HTH-type transcriptional activator Btr [compost metagenome]
MPSLGIEPVYITDLFAYPGVSKQEYTELLEQNLGNMKEARPDLILCDHYHLELRDRFKAFAPHIFIDFHGWAWRTNFMKISELLDRKPEAEQTLARLELRIADVREELKGIIGNKRVTVMQVNHKGIGIQGKHYHPLNELLYAELAIAPGLQTPSDIWRWEFQPEELPHLDTDYLFIQKHHLRAGSETVFNRMLLTASWSEMRAVREQEVRLIPNWFVMSWTPIGRNQIIDLLLTLE